MKFQYTLRQRERKNYFLGQYSHLVISKLHHLLCAMCWWYTAEADSIPPTSFLAHDILIHINKLQVPVPLNLKALWPLDPSLPTHRPGWRCQGRQCQSQVLIQAYLLWLTENYGISISLSSWHRITPRYCQAWSQNFLTRSCLVNHFDNCLGNLLALFVVLLSVSHIAVSYCLCSLPK